MTAKQAIIDRLKESPKAIAIHEMEIPGVSQTAISARLRELNRQGVVVGSIRPGKQFKEWTLLKCGSNSLVQEVPKD